MEKWGEVLNTETVQKPKKEVIKQGSTLKINTDKSLFLSESNITFFSLHISYQKKFKRGEMKKNQE